jgi:hypothetical protein
MMSRVFVFFTRRGLYANAGYFRFFVPIPLDIDSFTVPLSDLNDLLKATGDVIFSLDEDLSHVTFTECNITKQKDCKVDIVDFNEFCELPEETIESSDFLEAVSMSRAFVGKGDQSSLFCLDGEYIVATNGYRMIFGKIEIPLFDTPFLLDSDIVSLVPKSGVCRLAKVFYPVQRWSDQEVETCLYVGLSDCHIWVSSTEGRFKRWRGIIPQQNSDTHKLHIDTRDVSACVRRLGVLPKDSKKDNFVRFCVEGDRLCIESCAERGFNTRLRFSELTTGNVSSVVCFDVEDIQAGLQISNELWQNPVAVSKETPPTNREYMEVLKFEPLVFESDKMTVLVMSRALKKDVQKVTNTVELKEFWKPNKEPVIKKQLKRNALFVSVDKDRIAVLQTENEQLKKELEQLRNTFINLQSSKE